MNIYHFTESVRGVIRAAQLLAKREGHQQFSTPHILRILLEDTKGLARSLIDRAGGDSRAILQATQESLNRLPKGSGAWAGRTYLAPETSRAFTAAQRAAQRAGDVSVTVERLLQALAADRDSATGKLLAAGGITRENLKTAINALRKGRAVVNASPSTSDPATFS